LVLLIISFAFFILSKIAEARREESLFLQVGMLGFICVAFFTRGLDIQSAMAVMGFLILSLAIAELIARPILSWGTLHSWDEYESYFWTTRDDAAVVVPKQRQKFREAFASRLVRLTVPPESVEAVTQLLEANLPNSSEARETVKA
jgi:hypothetical protein